MHDLTIDSERLWASLDETAAFGACAGGGIARLALTPEDALVRDWFRTNAERTGCVVTVDEVGNMFARRSGRHDDLDPIAMGSHLDTQPTGGRFDGVLGVLAGLEVLRTLEDAGHVTNAPLEIVNWTNEEGCRFAPAMLASGVFAGVFTPEYAWSRRDRDGVSFGEALDAIGYRGAERAGGHRIGALFELHIEQGPILEAEGVPVGIVTGGQGARWYDVTLMGRPGHTGATPMRLRKNALLGAAQLIAAIDGIARTHGPDAVATVGSLEVSPNSRNVIPGEVYLTVDLRHPEVSVLSRMVAAFETALPAIAGAAGLRHQVETILDSPSVRFSPELVACVEAGADRAGLAHRRMVSGAAHDAVYLCRIVPTTMIFVPCRDGVSHNVEEWADPETCAAGAQVLLNAVLAYDDRLAHPSG